MWSFDVYNLNTLLNKQWVTSHLGRNDAHVTLLSRMKMCQPPDNLVTKQGSSGKLSEYIQSGQALYDACVVVNSSRPSDAYMR